MAFLDIPKRWFIWNQQMFTEEITSDTLLNTLEYFLIQSRRRGRQRACRLKWVLLIIPRNVSRHGEMFQKWLFISTFFQQSSQLLVKLTVNSFLRDVCVLVFLCDLFCVIEVRCPGKCSAINAILHKHELGADTWPCSPLWAAVFAAFCSLLPSEHVYGNKDWRRGDLEVVTETASPHPPIRRTGWSAVFSGQARCQALTCNFSLTLQQPS